MGRQPIRYQHLPSGHPGSAQSGTYVGNRFARDGAAGPTMLFGTLPVGLGLERSRPPLARLRSGSTSGASNADESRWMVDQRASSRPFSIVEMSAWETPACSARRPRRFGRTQQGPGTLTFTLKVAPAWPCSALKWGYSPEVGIPRFRQYVCADLVADAATGSAHSGGTSSENAQGGHRDADSCFVWKRSRHSLTDRGR